MIPAYPILIPMLAGLAVTTWALLHALRNLRALRRADMNGPRKIVARQSVRNAAIIMAAHLVLIAAVAWSSRLPAGRDFLEVMLVRNWFSVIASALLSTASLCDWRDWRRIKRLYGLDQL